MVRTKQSRLFIAVGIGLLGGLILSGLWPNAPLYAVATDRIDSFAMATGPVDSELEALYLLDLLTGDLTALVLGKQPGIWSGQFHANVAADLGIDPQRNAKYLMVTGMVPLRRGGGSRQQPSSAMCYVAEITSGRVAAYTIPWSPSMYAAGQMQRTPLLRAGTTQFRQVAGEMPPQEQPSGRRVRNRE